MKKRLCNGFVLLVLVLLASLTGCQRTAPALTPVTVQFKFLHDAQFGGFYAADQNGCRAAAESACPLASSQARIESLCVLAHL